MTVDDSDTYLRHLAWAHRAEVFGEALYATAARFARDPGRRRKWEVLAQLETRTKTRLVEALDRQGTLASPAKLQRLLGMLTGALAASFPWRLTLRVLGIVSNHTAARLERPERDAPNDHAAILQHLTAHERAQCEFVARELAGDEKRSLDQVLVLLRDDALGSDDATQV